MEARNRKLEEWFTEIKNGYIALPRFQRFEAWSHQQVASLLDTVLNDLPAGAVLTLDIGDDEPFISRPVVGAPKLSNKVSSYLLDGQQRLTALWRSLNNDYDGRMFYIKVKEDGAFEAFTKGLYYKTNGQQYPLWANNPEQQWDRSLIPVDILKPGSESEANASSWAEKASGGDSAKLIKLVTLIAKLRPAIAGFNIPFLSLPKSTTKETALDVFIKMNTSSSPLTAYDIVVAQVEAGTGQSLHDLVDDINVQAVNAKKYMYPADWALAVGALLQGKTPTRATYLESNFSNELINKWEDVKRGIKRATDFLAEQKVFDGKRLATDVVLYPLAALWSQVPDGGDGEGEARVILKKYLWRAFFTERYERTSATRALSDFKSLTKVLSGDLEEKPLIFNEEEFPLPTAEELKTAAWPKSKERLARAILAISLNNGAYDFADGSIVTSENISQREYHHLFPDAYLKGKGLKSKEIYLALNCGLVTWRTNRNMAAKAPSVYMNERMNVGEDEVERRLNSHLIGLESLQSDDYAEFLESRSQLVHEAMIEICT